MRRRTFLAQLAIAMRWFISGAPDSRWPDDELSTIQRVLGRNFEVVRMDGLVS